MVSRSQEDPRDTSFPLRLRGFAALLVALSFGLNVAALFLPFMKLRKGILNEAYSLPYSVEMLWSEGLVALAVLVLLFSILFPFAKLALLAWVIGSPHLNSTKVNWLRRVEHMGKWSMLDVLLVSIILSLASNQIMVGAKPQLGLTFFIVAILLSMACGELLVRNLPVNRSEPLLKEHVPSSGVLLFFFTLSLFACLLFPFLRIDDWLLSNHEYSILMLVPALWGQGAWLAAVLSALFLIAAPLLACAVTIGQWFAKRNKKHPPQAERDWLQVATRWSMLDVFGLALFIFAIESDYLLSARIQWGALFLASTLALQALLSQALKLERAEAERISD